MSQVRFCFKINIVWRIVFEYWFPKKTKLMWQCFLHVSLLVCPTSNNFWLLSNFNISEQSSEKQIHLDNKESVQDTENQILLFHLLMEMLDSYVTYGFDLFLYQVGKGYFKTQASMISSWSRLVCFDGELWDDRLSCHTGEQARRSASLWLYGCCFQFLCMMWLGSGDLCLILVTISAILSVFLFQIGILDFLC